MVTVMTTDITEAGAHEAVQNFAQALADTPEFHAFEEAAVAFKNDPPAREAWQQFQAKQRSLQMIQRLGALSQEELDELKRLQRALFLFPSFTAYTEAQAELIEVCQAAAKEISAVIDLDFASACTADCCG